MQLHKFSTLGFPHPTIQRGPGVSFDTPTLKASLLYFSGPNNRGQQRPPPTKPALFPGVAFASLFEAAGDPPCTEANGGNEETLEFYLCLNPDCVKFRQFLIYYLIYAQIFFNIEF